MVSCLDVEPNRLISKAAEKLEKEGGVEKPEFIDFVKSGCHKERLPIQGNFWYLRCASILRQAYRNGVIGVSRLRTHYGGRENRGVKPERHRKAGGAIIRRAIQALEKAGYLQKGPNGVGRIISPKGAKLLAASAKEASSQ